MSERIDHAAEALRALDLFHTLGSKAYERLSSEALVHAILALVEQQRIANLIAVNEHIYLGEPEIRVTESMIEGAPTIAYEHTPTLLREDVKEALGL